MEDCPNGGMSFKTTNGGRTKATRYDRWSAKDKVRGKKKTNGTQVNSSAEGC